MLDILAHAGAVMRIRWRIDGFRFPPRPVGIPRDWMGFKDGITNPDTTDATDMNQQVWVQPGAPEPAWTAGGTYQVVRIIRMFLDQWGKVPVEQQERIFGRRKLSGAPMYATSPDAPDTLDPIYTNDPQGLVTPLNCHIRLANPQTPQTLATSSILRRSFQYAASQAHSHGLVLGCAHRQLLRIPPAGTPRGHIHLTCLLADPEATPAEDVRGLGAALYALLTGHWPLPEVELAGRAHDNHDALRDSQQGPLAPLQPIDPQVPVEVSALALGALAADDAPTRVRTAATVHQVITDLLAAERHAEDDRDDATPPRRGFGPSKRSEPIRRLRQAYPTRRSRGHQPTVVGALVLVLLGAISYLGVHLAGLSPSVTHATSGTSPASRPGAAAAPSRPGQPPSASAVVVAAQVYDPTGQPDNPEQVWRAFGTDPRAGWSTDTYFQPFPALKPVPSSAGVTWSRPLTPDPAMLVDDVDGHSLLNRVAVNP
jgi:hypothetical protein